VYGLPHQSAQTFEQTIDTVFRLDSDRVALFSYAHVSSMNAHVPSMKKHQRLIDTDALPAPDEKLRTFKMATERLTGDGGYRFIGMDSSGWTPLPGRTTSSVSHSTTERSTTTSRAIRPARGPTWWHLASRGSAS